MFVFSAFYHLQPGLTQVLHLSRLEIHSLSWIIATLLLTLKLCQACYYTERCYCLNIWSSLIGHDTCMRYGFTEAQNRAPGVLTEWKVLLIPQEGKTGCTGSQSSIIRPSVGRLSNSMPMSSAFSAIERDIYTVNELWKVSGLIISWRYDECSRRIFASIYERGCLAEGVTNIILPLCLWVLFINIVVGSL